MPESARPDGAGRAVQEVTVPPLSAPVDHFRREVSARAIRLTRRRRRTVGGVAAAVLLVAAAVPLLTVGPGGVPAHRVAAGPATTRATGGEFAPSAPDAARSRANSPAADQPPATVGSTSNTSNTSNTVLILHPPVGTTNSVDRGMEATVVLAAPAVGRWGTARITRGSGSVLALVRQVGDTGGGTRVTVRAVADGVADITIPCLGHQASSWHGSFEVSNRVSPSSRHPG